MWESEKKEMCNIFKAVIVILSLILSYNYIMKTNPTPVKVRIDNPKFVLLGPYNTTDYELDDTYDQLIDIKNFSFKVNPQPCYGYEAGLLLVVIISSHPSHFEQRSTIRKTWGKSTDSTKIIFLLGETESLPNSKQIENETLTHGDIVQGNFKDAYRNMTYKHVMGLKWVAHHCPTAKYVLKTDDDVVVNSHALKQFLAREMSPWGASGLIGCQVLMNAQVKRKDSKWVVSKNEYADSHYPTYCAGWAILYSRDVIPKLLTTAQTIPYFWIDDVHITGIIAEMIGVARTPLTSLILSGHRMNLLQTLGPKYAGNFLFGPPDLTVSKVSQIWKAIPA